jgi:hypothetical protein
VAIIKLHFAIKTHHRVTARKLPSKEQACLLTFIAAHYSCKLLKRSRRDLTKGRDETLKQVTSLPLTNYFSALQPLFKKVVVCGRIIVT